MRSASRSAAAGGRFLREQAPVVGGERLARATPCHAAWLLLACALCIGAARAATFTVDWEADAVDAVPGDGICATSFRRCTLRAAVQEANARPGADVVLVPAGAYLLSIAGTEEDLAATGDLDVHDELTLLGAGARLTTIDAVTIDRCLEVFGGACHIDGLTVRGGWLEPDGCPIPFGGGLSVRDGGALTLVDCHVTDCLGLPGGGIYLGPGSSLEAHRTSIVANRSWACPRNLEFGGSGGGIFADSGATVLLVNVTLFDNSADCGSAIMAEAANVRLRNCTVTRNGGNGDLACLSGALDGPGFEAGNTLVAGNGSGSCPDCRGAIASLGYDLIGAEPSCCVVTGDLTGNVMGALPNLARIANNGGPVDTCKPLTGSPAMDAGNPLPPGSGEAACEATDARGVPRPQDGDANGVSTCDIGAFELGFEAGLCADGADNDGDALVDCADDDCCGDGACAGLPETQCCDLADNDCDGDVDLADADCATVPDCFELDCANGADDDGDRLVDCFDEDCCGRDGCGAPEAQCCDAIDNDCDGMTDGADPDCAAAPPCVESDCANGVDEDVDGRLDCADPDCRGTPMCDDDGDGAPNGLDCAPDDPSAIAVPTEIPRLDVGRLLAAGRDVVVLGWTDLSGAAGPGLVTDIFVGGIARMWADRGLAGASCLAGDVRVLQRLDFRGLPGASDGFWYLVRGENACGRGPLGDDSLGVPRDLAGVSCP
jgi:hypothetical protein